MGFRSDGESKIASLKNGFVGKLLKDLSHLAYCHCIAHCLALGAKDLLENLLYLKDLNRLISNICTFLEGSPKRLQILRDH